MTSHLVYRVALWDYLGENLDFNMDRIVMMRERYLTLSQMPNFRLVQTGGVCRQQFQI